MWWCSHIVWQRDIFLDNWHASLLSSACNRCNLVVGVTSDCTKTFPKIYIMIQTLIKRRCVMKSYDELKAEMETIQQQMAEGRVKQ